MNVPGVLHFGVWNRGHAAECTFGSRDAAQQIPLGFTLEFEVDDVETARSARINLHALNRIGSVNFKCRNSPRAPLYKVLCCPCDGATRRQCVHAAISH